jgi:chromosome segregation ATPase
MESPMGGAIPHVDSTTGTGKAPRAMSDAPVYDWDRLERAVGALVARHEELQGKVRTLGVELAERESRIRGLEAQLLQANQRRSDTSKRIDELIAQLDQLDAQLDYTEPVA